MKKFFRILFVLTLCLSLCGCEFQSGTIVTTESGTVDDVALYEHSLELAGLLQEMLRSPEYFELMGGSDHLREVIDPLILSDLSHPESAYLVVLSEETPSLLMNAVEIDMDKFSDGLRKFLERRMFHSVPTILNSQSGAETLAAASILTVSNAWAGANLEQNSYVVLSYPDACPVMVSFCGGNGLMEGTATMLIGTTLDEDSMQSISTLFHALGLEGIHVQKLEIDHD